MVVSHVNTTSILCNILLLIISAVMVSAVMGHTNGFFGPAITLLILCHANQLEWVKSIESIISIHHILGILLILEKRYVDTDAFPILDGTFDLVTSL